MKVPQHNTIEKLSLQALTLHEEAKSSTKVIVKHDGKAMKPHTNNLKL